MITVANPHQPSALEALEHRFGSAGALRNAETELQKMLHSRGIYFGDGILPTCAFAFVQSNEVVTRWARQSELLIRSADHVARQLVTDIELYDRMGLDRSALDLIRIDPGYKRHTVLCRPDGIPTGADLKFVELNCDSPAMMMFLDLVADCLLQLDEFAGMPRPASAADKLLDALIDCYREFAGAGAAAPTIAITDWAGQKTRYEHMRLAEYFEARGCQTIVCDPRSFERVHGRLYSSGRCVDLVYRRALSSELIERRAEVTALLDAYRDGSVCMVNPLHSYVAGAKAVLSYIAEPSNLPADLAEASSLLPRTLLLDRDEVRELVRASPARWALKKSESHGGMNVVLPNPETRVAWLEALDASRREAWIAQEYIPVPRMTVPCIPAACDGVASESIGSTAKYFNWNPFVFGGKYAGGLVRVSETPLINICLGGGLLPTFAI